MAIDDKDTRITMRHKDREVDVGTLDEFTEKVEAFTNENPRLPGTDYTHVTVSKQNGDWMDTVPDIGDELTLRMRVRVTEKGKRLTDDGLQATVKVEVVGSPSVIEKEGA